MTNLKPRPKKVGDIPLPRPLRKPHEQVSRELNQNGLGDYPMDMNSEFISDLNSEQEFLNSLNEVEPMDVDIKPEKDDTKSIHDLGMFLLHLHILVSKYSEFLISVHTIKKKPSTPKEVIDYKFHT